MIAGTLAVLDDAVDDPLESEYRRTRGRAFDVRATQQDFNGGSVQSGVAVDTKDASMPRVDFVSNGDETIGVEVEREDAVETVVSEWVADVTDTGIVAAESTADTGDVLAFPFNHFEARTGVDVTPLRIDIQSLYGAWLDSDSLADVWLKGVEDEPEDDDEAGGVAIDYHDHATVEGGPADLGVGFRVRWGGTVARGVAYSSGYVALYNAATAGEYIEFINDEVLDHCLGVERDDTDTEQSTLGGGL